MTRLRTGQFLEFKKCVAKVTRLGSGRVSLRKYSLGNMEKGYHYQQVMKLDYLDKKIEKGEVKIIPWDEVLRILFFAIKKGKRQWE